MVNDFVGVSEIAQLAGVSSSAVTNWRRRWDSTTTNPFPRPVAELASGPVFHINDVTKWLRSTERLVEITKGNFTQGVDTVRKAV